MTAFEIITQIVLPLLSLLGVGGLFTGFWADRRQKRLDQEAANSEAFKAQQKATRQQEMREVFNECVQPLQQDLANVQKEISNVKESVDRIDTSLTSVEKGTVTLLRTEMRDIKDQCKERGWASESDKANWNELYNTYADLGGNHFKEYVDQWAEIMSDLPTAESTAQSQKTTTKSTKKRIDENAS